MNTKTISLFWAVLLILLAMASKAGWITPRTAQWLIIVLPVAAVLHLLKKRGNDKSSECCW